MTINQPEPQQAPIWNPLAIPPSWWDQTWEDETEPEWRFGAPMPGSLLPCGCHLRRPDYEAVLCDAHLAELNGRIPVSEADANLTLDEQRAARSDPGDDNEPEL